MQRGRLPRPSFSPPASSAMTARYAAPNSCRADDGGRPRRACGRAAQTQSMRPPLAKIQASRMASPFLPASVGWPASSETRSARAAAAMPARAGAERRGAASQRPRTARGRSSRCAGRARCARAAPGAANIRAGAVRRRRRSARWNRSRCRSAPPAARKRGAGKNAIAEIRLGDRAQARRPRRLPPAGSVSASVMCVAWIRHQRRSTGAWSSSHSTGRAPDQATQSSTSRSARRHGCGSARPASAIDCLQFVRRHGAQAVRRDAHDSAVQRSPPRARLHQAARRSRRRSLMKRRWPSFGAAPPKPRARRTPAAG